MSFRDEFLRRAQEYTQRNNLVLGEELGFGVHGIVFVTESQRQKDPFDGRSAIKVHQREPDYRRERDVYLRLREKASLPFAAATFPSCCTTTINCGSSK